MDFYYSTLFFFSLSLFACSCCNSLSYFSHGLLPFLKFTNYLYSFNFWKTSCQGVCYVPTNFELTENKKCWYYDQGFVKKIYFKILIFNFVFLKLWCFFPIFFKVFSNFHKFFFPQFFVVAIVWKFFTKRSISYDLWL
jgi:hypothetical protein